MNRFGELTTHFLFSFFFFRYSQIFIQLRNPKPKNYKLLLQFIYLIIYFYKSLDLIYISLMVLTFIYINVMVLTFMKRLKVSNFSLINIGNLTTLFYYTRDSILKKYHKTKEIKIVNNINHYNTRIYVKKSPKIRENHDNQKGISLFEKFVQSHSFLSFLLYDTTTLKTPSQISFLTLSTLTNILFYSKHSHNYRLFYSKQSHKYLLLLYLFYLMTTPKDSYKYPLFCHLLL